MPTHLKKKYTSRFICKLALKCQKIKETLSIVYAFRITHQLQGVYKIITIGIVDMI